MQNVPSLLCISLLCRETAELGKIDSMIEMIKDHMEKGGELISQEDVLDVVRPFCADLEVKVNQKMELLQLLEKSFQLSGEDIFLLVYYQTDAIVSAAWGIKVF